MISMRYVEEYIQNIVSKRSQLHAYEIAKELWDLLKALDEKDHLRPELRGTKEEEKREEYVRIARNSDKILASFNKFHDMYVNREKREKFFELTKEFGFTDEDLSHLLHAQLVVMFLLNAEMFKNFLAFILRDVNPKKTLGNLFQTEGKNLGLLIKVTQETGEASNIAKRLNINLRNSLAHFMFREDGRTIYYYTHQKKGKYWVLKEQKIDSTDLFNEMQEHNLLRTILGIMIADWYGL